MSGRTSVNAKRDSVTQDMKNLKSLEITTQISTTPLEDKLEKDEMDIDGVACLTLSKETQKFIGFVIGRKITPEVLWTHITKEAIETHIAIYGMESEFFEISDAVKKFTGTEMFLGCSATLEAEHQFYLCVNEKSEKETLGILMRKKLKLESQLENTIHKTAKPWKSCGSEKDVNDEIVKNTRPLLEKEMAITVSSEKLDIKFCDQGPEMLNNGYVRCISRKDIINIQKKRYSQGIQACPSVHSAAAQTNPGFPTNVWTQYEYEPQISADVVRKELSKNIKPFQSHAEKIESMINYNEKIDLYENDFPNLVLNEQDTVLPEQVSYEEYETFIDIENCCGKLISCAVWHPVLVGVVAIAYVRQPHFLYIHEKRTTGNGNNGNIDNIDDVFDAVYENNLVLIWSISDKYTPMLFLESPREVHSLQFSPSDGNILVGGLINGQIIVWDLNEKLSVIHEQSFNFEESSNTHLAISAHLGWMKEKKSEKYILPCAISSLDNSHETCVTGIQWLSPFWHITEKGEIEQMKDNVPSLEFMSCTHDGSVNVWALKFINEGKIEETHEPKEFPTNTSHAKDKSPKTFVLKPHFKVLTSSSEDIEHETDSDGQLSGVPLSAIAVDYMYHLQKMYQSVAKIMEQSTQEKHTPLTNSDVQETGIETVTHVEQCKKSEVDEESHDLTNGDKQSKGVTVGTLDGVVTRFVWNDVDSDTEQAAGPKVASFVFWGNVHDGPVTTLVRSPFIHDLLLSVGGKIFAIWKESAKEVLLYRRKSSVSLTSGSWSIHRTSMFYITRVDGKMELWDLFEQSHKDSFSQSLSGKLLTGIYPYVQCLPHNIVGLADINAQFRMLCVPNQHVLAEHNEVEKLQNLIQREVSRKESYISWQNQWEAKNAEMLQARKEAAELFAKRQEEADREKARKAKELRKKKEQEMEARRIRQAEIRAKSFTWKQDAEKKWNKKHEEHLIKTRLQQKKLDKEKLQLEQKPYTSLLEEEAIKKNKLEQKLKDKQHMYETAVKFHFPELTEDSSIKTTKQEERYAETVDIKSYEEIKKQALMFIESNPFDLQFDWCDFMKEAHARERFLQKEMVEAYFSCKEDWWR